MSYCMDLLTLALKQKIDDLVTIDRARQSAIPKAGIDYFSSDKPHVEARRQSHEHRLALSAVLETLDKNELRVIVALTMYGNPNGSFDDNASIGNALADATDFIETTPRDHVLDWLSKHAFSRYLQAALQHAGIQ